MAEYYNGLNVKLTEEEARVNAVFIRDYLLGKGWSMGAICGTLGNFDAETGGTLNPNVFEGWKTHSSALGKYGYGLAQWTPWLGTSTYNTPESQRNYHGSGNPTLGRWCLDNGRAKETIEAQLDYLGLGLGGYKSTSSFPETFNEFTRSERSPNYLAKVFYVNYERSAAGAYGDRPDRADKWYEYFTGGEAPPADPNDPDIPEIDQPEEPEEDPKKKGMSLPVFLAATRRRLHVVR